MASAPPGAEATRIDVRWKSAAVRGLLAIAIVLLLKVAAPLLLPIATAVMLTFVLSPLIRVLRRRGVPEPVGSAVVVGTLLVATLLLSSALAGPAAQWLERAPSTVAQVMTQIDRLRESIVRMGIPTRQPPTKAARAAPQPPDPLKERIASEGVTLTRVVVGKVLSFGLSAAATVILLYFLLASEHWMLSRTVEAIPRRRSRALLLGGVRCAEREIGRYLASLAVVNVGVTFATALAMWWCGLPNPLLWGVVAGALNFIPYLGPVVTAALLALAGVVTFDNATDMLAPAMAFVLIQVVENNFVTPWFVGRRLSLSPLAVFLSVMFWGWLWGIVGALLAVPFLVGARTVCKRRRGLRLWSVYLEGANQPAPSLRSLLSPRRRIEQRQGRPG